MVAAMRRTHKQPAWCLCYRRNRRACFAQLYPVPITALQAYPAYLIHYR